MSERSSTGEKTASKIARFSLPEELLDSDQPMALRRILRALEKRGVNIPPEQLVLSGGEQERLGSALKRTFIHAVPATEIPGMTNGAKLADAQNNPFEHARKGATNPVVVILDKAHLASMAYREQGELDTDLDASPNRIGQMKVGGQYISGNQELAWEELPGQSLRDAVVGIVTFRPEDELAELRQRRAENLGATALR